MAAFVFFFVLLVSLLAASPQGGGGVSARPSYSNGGGAHTTNYWQQQASSKSSPMRANRRWIQEGFPEMMMPSPPPPTQQQQAEWEQQQQQEPPAPPAVVLGGDFDESTYPVSTSPIMMDAASSVPWNLGFRSEALDTPEKPMLLDTSSPLLGSLTAGEMRYFQINTTNKDVLIILESIGGGDIDVYCTPADGLLGLMKPSPSFSVWKSEHGAGHDHVFIGRRDSFYSATVNCVLAAFTSSDFSLAVELTEGERNANSSTVAAMNDVFRDCCTESPMSCMLWKETAMSIDAVMPASALCHMDGVALCDASGGVTHLDLSNFDMRCDAGGSLKDALGSMQTSLVRLDISGNPSLTGDIGEVLTAIRAAPLQSLDASKTSLKGTIDSNELFCEGGGDSRLSSLHSLSLEPIHDEEDDDNHEDGHEITMTFPACLLRSSLVELVVRHVDVPSGKLFDASSTTDLPQNNLTTLVCEDCNLKGSLPESVFTASPKLMIINLENNELTGEMPELAAESPIVSIELDDNQFAGRLPASYVNAKDIGHISVSNNRLTALPMDLDVPSPPAKLSLFMASNNSISGAIPSWLVMAQELMVLDLGGNELSGTLPTQDNLFPTARIVILANNTLSGELPDAFQDSSLFSSRIVTMGPFALKHVLDLTNNALSGRLPVWLAEIRAPPHLDVKLSGNYWSDCEGEDDREMQLSLAAFGWTGACTKLDMDGLHTHSTDGPTDIQTTVDLPPAAGAQEEILSVKVEQEEPSRGGVEEETTTTTTNAVTTEETTTTTQKSRAGMIGLNAFLGTVLALSVVAVVILAVRYARMKRRKEAARRFVAEMPNVNV